MPAFLTILSHWRRHPGQLATLILGLALATALWSGVQAINEEARQSYARAAGMLGANGYERLQMPGGGPVPLADYSALRRAGWQVSPVIRGELEADGETWRVMGVEPLTAPPDMLPNGGLQAGIDPGAFLGGPGQAFVADGAEIDPNGQFGLEFIPHPDIAPGLIVTDIGVAARLLDQTDPSFLILLPDQPAGLPDLASVTDLVRVEPQGGEDLSRLTDSFHLNLTAFGFLSFAVGLFIVHATIGLAFEQRRPVFRTLRAIGLPLSRLILVLLAEVTLLALLAGGLGVALGYLVAAALLPDVAGTLRNLYGAEIDGTLAFRPLWAGVGLGIALVGAWLSAAQALWQVARMPLLAPAQPRAWAIASARSTRLQAVAGVLLLAASGAAALVGTGLVMGFLCLGALLLGAALLLPGALSLALRGIGARLRGPLAEWVIADTRQQLPGLSLALMALLLALAANIGVSTMVGSFRLTFLGWLDQRLVAELYVTAADNEEAAEIRAFLAPLVDATLPIANAETRIGGQPVFVYGVVDHATYRDHWPLLETTPAVWDRVATGQVLLVNEQMARAQELSLGDGVDLAPGLSLPVGGVYSDYGNPTGQAIMSLDLLERHFAPVDQSRSAVRVDPEQRQDVIAALDAAFALPEGAVVDQQSVKQASIRVFEQTFRVTGALNILTLGVATFALLASLMTLSSMRLPQVAPLWALGQTRARLARIEVMKTLALVVLTGAVALPVGLALAWVLLAVVNVEAFGWRLPMQVFPLDWLRLLGLALLTSTLAAAYPAVGLLRTPPAHLLKVFSNER
ncbi:ABC transporter permease [Rhodobacteraceae bacterium W635]|uniref:ABC transporter permease n=1 Tax=Nioella halotolerans TaxID=2303578 RepID=UPI000E3C24DE|nr:ABC transporter permease [Rhodobacteraceae bacterium W635]